MCAQVLRPFAPLDGLAFLFLGGKVERWIHLCLGEKVERLGVLQPLSGQNRCSFPQRLEAAAALLSCWTRYLPGLSASTLARVMTEPSVNHPQNLILTLCS